MQEYIESADKVLLEWNVNVIADGFGIGIPIFYSDADVSAFCIWRNAIWDAACVICMHLPGAFAGLCGNDLKNVIVANRSTVQFSVKIQFTLFCAWFIKIIR